MVLCNCVRVQEPASLGVLARIEGGVESGCEWVTFCGLVSHLQGNFTSQ